MLRESRRVADTGRQASKKPWLYGAHSRFGQAARTMRQKSIPKWFDKKKSRRGLVATFRIPSFVGGPFFPPQYLSKVGGRDRRGRFVAELRFSFPSSPSPFLLSGSKGASKTGVHSALPSGFFFPPTVPTAVSRRGAIITFHPSCQGSGMGGRGGEEEAPLPPAASSK